MRPTAFLALLLGLLGSGCDRPNASSAPALAVPAPERAPDVSWQMNGEQISLTSLRGQTVLLHFADAASPSWTALDEAYPDLNAEGATVLGVVTDDAPFSEHPYGTVSADKLETAFGITTTPAAVIVDADGWVRGRDHALDADAFFELAAPVLLDESTNAPVPVPDPADRQLAVADLQFDAEALHQLVRAGAALIDLRSDEERTAEGWIRLALPCPLDALSTEVLPADLSATLVFLGPDADAAAELAAEWGYVSLLSLSDAAPYVMDGAARGELATPGEAPLSRARRVRG
ncbi:MAG: hypothetical protein AAF170_15135 [Bacteroidota bacterium]